MVSRYLARGGLTPWVSSARRTVGDAPVMKSRMPWRLALAATRLIALAAVESRNGTAAKSTTNALRLSAMLSSTAPTVDAAPKKNAPVMRYTSTSGSAARPES